MISSDRETDIIRYPKTALLPTMLIFLIFGLDLFASFPDAPVTLIKVIVLSLILLVCSIILCRIHKYSFATPTFPFCLLYIYLSLLTIRLVNDFVVEDHELFIYGSSVTLFAIFFLTIFLPAICFGLRKFDLDFSKFLIILQILCGIILTITVKNIMDGNIEISYDRRSFGVGALDIIYLGHQGVTLIFLSIYNLRIKKLIPICVLTFIIGILSLVYSDSRGPLVALVLGLIIFTLVYCNTIFKKVILCLFITLFFLFYEPILFFISDFLESFDIYSFKRILLFLLGDGGSSGRDVVLTEGLELFYENPFWGSSYLLPDDMYVHNIVLEQFMALGLFGGLIFLVLLIITLIQGVKLVARDKDNSIIFILFVQYFCFGLFSRTAIAIPQFFMIMYIILHLSKNKYQGQQILIDDDGFDNNSDIQK